MRVTESARFDQLQQHLQRTTGSLNKVSEHLASGRKVLRLSDDPEQAVQAERLTAETRALDAYASAADNARSWLSTQDSALQGGVHVLQRARELVISAGFPLSPAAREGIALELEGLRSQLVDTANTTFNGRAVFGGFSGGAVDDSGGAVSFVGDDGVVQRRIAKDRVVQINTLGRETFGFADGDDVFAFLDDVAAHVRADDVASITGSDLDRLDTHTNRFTEALGNVGAAVNHVENTLSTAELRQDAIREGVSSIMDADLAQTALELTIAETAYQAVLSATARLQLPSLVDYLR